MKVLLNEVHVRLVLFFVFIQGGCKDKTASDAGDTGVQSDAWVANDDLGGGTVSDGDEGGGDSAGEDSGSVDAGDGGGSGSSGGSGGSGGSEGSEGTGGDGGTEGGEIVPLVGFIGSPCATDEDCEFDGGICLLDGFPEGHCSVPCDLYCPDEDGYPMTFCVDGEDLPGPSLTGGWCTSRCSFAYYPSDGCREDYGCRVESRHSEPGTQTYACIPGEGTDLSECQIELAERGVGFEPTIRGIDHPEGRPDMDCEIVDPVWVETPLFGVDLQYVESTDAGRVLAGCEMAHALADTVEDVGPYGVSTLLHIGTYNCRMISGTDSLSEHSFANAIDIYGFEFDDGRRWTLIDDWEHDTTAPSSDAARFLYESSRRWYDEWIWNIILTPNYNSDHDNHFHVDLKPGFHDLSFTSGRYYGPAPYWD